jgi:hypothetical protein
LKLSCGLDLHMFRNEQRLDGIIDRLQYRHYQLRQPSRGFWALQHCLRHQNVEVRLMEP